MSAEEKIQSKINELELNIKSIYTEAKKHESNRVKFIQILILSDLEKCAIQLEVLKSLLE